MARLKRAAFLFWVLLIVAVTTTVSELRGRGQTPPPVPENQRAEIEKAKADFEAQFPVADYNSTEPDSATARQRRKIKSARHNNGRFLKKDDASGEISDTTL